MEIKIKIDAPGLEKAISSLAAALNGGGLIQPTAPVEDTKEPEKDTLKSGKPNKTVEKDTKTTEKKTEPKEESTTGLTYEQVRIKLAEVSQEGKQKELKALITSLGAEKLSDIPEEKYAELLEKADDL